MSQEETLTGLLNTLQAQQSVFGQEFSRGHLHPFKERKGQRHFEVRASDKLRTDSTVVCKNPARNAKDKKTLWRVQILRISRGIVP